MLFCARLSRWRGIVGLLSHERVSFEFRRGTIFTDFRASSLCYIDIYINDSIVCFNWLLANSVYYRNYIANTAILSFLKDSLFLRIKKNDNFFLNYRFYR